MYVHIFDYFSIYWSDTGLHLRVPCYKHFFSISNSKMVYELMFGDTMNDVDCIRILGGHYFLSWYSNILTVCFVFRRIWTLKFDMFRSLPRYYFNTKTVYICLEDDDKIS